MLYLTILLAVLTALVVFFGVLLLVAAVVAKQVYPNLQRTMPFLPGGKRASSTTPKKASS